MVFSFASAAVVCAILDSIRQVETSNGDDGALILKTVTFVQFFFLPLTVILMLIPSVLLVISFDFSPPIFMPKAEEVLCRRSTREAGGSSSLKPSCERQNASL